MLTILIWSGLSGMPSLVTVIPAPPFDWSCAAVLPSTYCALRLWTWMLLLTASGALPAGACSDSGVPLPFASVAIAFSLLDLPRMKDPPVAASAKPAAPITSASVTATVAGPTDRTAPRQRRSPGGITLANVCSLYGCAQCVAVG